MGRLTGDLRERTLSFGAAALSLVATLPHEPRGWIVGKQFGRAATSVGANVWEADAAFTEADFTHKISIARKEASEAVYWLELMERAHLVPKNTVSSIKTEANELLKILGAIVRKTQEHMQNEREHRA